MRNFALLCLLFSWVNSSLSAQLTSSISENTNEIETTEGAINILNEKEAILTVKSRFVILNKDSDANKFHVFYNPDNKIINIDADIYDLEGNRIRKVKKAEIRDVLAIGSGSIYTEDRIRFVELQYPEYPYVVEFSYKKKLSGISFAALPNWYFQKRNTTAVKKSSFTLTVPEGIDFQHKMYNLDIEPTIEQKGDDKTYTWVAENIASFEYESYSPPTHRLTPILRLTPKEFSIDGYKGSMQSWAAYGLFLNNLWEGRDDIPQELSQKIQTIIAPAKNDKEKIRLLYRYMQENMRYISVQLGIGGWQPFTAEHVNEHGYGDCKALSNYMRAMLKDIGMESYPVILQAGGQHPYEVEDQFVDPAFNHAILYVAAADMWLECTSSDAPAGYLGSFCNDRKVLLVTPEGGRLARTPKLSTAENIAQEQTAISIHTDGSAQISYQGDFAGISHEKWRSWLNNLSAEEVENKVRELGALPNIKFDSLIVKDDPLNPVSSITYSAAAPRYASKAGKRLFVPLNLICPQQYIPDVIENRVSPIVIPYGYTQIASITFTLPAGYSIESLPENKKIDSIFGSYSLIITQNEREITLKRQLQFYDKEQPATEYNALRTFFQEVAKYDDAKMVLVQD